MEIQSILTKICNAVWNSNDLEESKKITLDLINSSNIDENDKNTIIKHVNEINDKDDYDKYIANSLLYFEGLSTSTVPNQTPTFTKKGTIRKRKPKVKIEYFTEETEDAICEYNRSKDPLFRSDIYQNKIHYAFYKLSENIIHTFKFYYIEVDDIEHLKHEVITFLLDKIHLYDKPKGKAYSYFGTIAKRYLIIYNNNNYVKQKAKAELEAADEDNGVLIGFENSEKEQELCNFMEIYIKYVSNNIDTLFSKKIDTEIASAILEIFKQRDTPDFVFNKKALFIYIKEMVDVPTTNITRVIKKMKTLWGVLFNDFCNKGHI
jgi:hypothetical protein